jgi:RNA recognition motif-containing protein
LRLRIKKKFGFVIYAKDKDAEEAKQELNGKEFGGN